MPGTLIRSAEKDALREMDYAGEVPILVYNPHPYPVEADVEAEFQLGNQNHNEGEYTVARIYDQNGSFVPVQHEKPECSLSLDWRKKVVFHTTLVPMSMNRFDCTLEVMKDYQMIATFEETVDAVVVRSDRSEMRISKRTGLIDSFMVNGRERLEAGSGKICVFKDNEDPWGMKVKDFADYKGEFELVDESYCTGRTIQ